MKIILYGRTSLLDTLLSQVKELSHHVELHLLLELSPEGWQSSLFDVAPKSLPSGIIQADPVLRECFPVGVREFWRNTASFNLVVHNCAKSIHPATWQVSYQASQFMRRLQPDLIHFDGVSLRSVSGMPMLGRVPLVLSIHDPEPHTGEGNWRTTVACTLAFHRANQFILHNATMLEAFQSRYNIAPQKTQAIPLGVSNISREWIQASLSDDGRTVLFFGRLSPYKGLETLYQAAPLVAQEISDVRFVVAGRPIRGYTPPSAPSLPNGGHIEVINRYISNDELAQLFQQATLVTCPYTDATQSAVVTTAYAYNKPVVATQVGGLPEYIEDGISGSLVPARDPQALAQSLIDLLRNPQLRQHMSQGVRHLAETKLSWKRIAEQTTDVYKQVAHQSKRI